MYPSSPPHARPAQLVFAKGPPQTAIRQAVDDLLSYVPLPLNLLRLRSSRTLSLTAVRYYIRSYTQKQINAFAT